MRWMLLVLVLACEGGRSSRGDVASADTVLAPRDLVCADGECTDPATGLSWSAPGVTQDPIAACAGLASKSGKVYRVPNRSEALSFPIGDSFIDPHPAFKGTAGVLFLDDGKWFDVTPDGIAARSESSVGFTPICVSGP